MNKMKNADFLATFPHTLKNDKLMFTLGQLIAEELHITANVAEKNIIYTDIDRLSETWLDVLAYDLHVDWYDYDYPVEVKRELLKTSVRVHKKLGTVYAVETALNALHQGAKVEEWFEYGGNPFFFRVKIDTTKSNVETSYKDLVKVINTYKRLTARLEKIYCTFNSETTIDINYNNSLLIRSDFYPRFNIPLLFLDGLFYLDGKYILGGFATENAIDLYPMILSMKSHINCRKTSFSSLNFVSEYVERIHSMVYSVIRAPCIIIKEVELNNYFLSYVVDKEIVQNNLIIYSSYKQKVKAESKQFILLNPCETMINSNQSLFLLSQNIEEIGYKSKLTVEKDLWYLDDSSSLDGSHGLNPQIYDYQI